MKKGFTLIELLAVIIILAIVALIATPIVLDVVNDAKDSAAKSETSMIVSGINNYCAASAMKEQLNGATDICKDGVTKEEVSTMVDLGNVKINSITYDKKVTSLEVESNGRTIKYDGSKYTIDGEVVDTPEEPQVPTYTAYSVGDEVTLNDGTTWVVVKNTTTSESEIKIMSTSNIHPNLTTETGTAMFLNEATGGYKLAYDNSGNNSNVWANSTLKAYLDTTVKSRLEASLNTKISDITIWGAEELTALGCTVTGNETDGYSAVSCDNTKTWYSKVFENTGSWTKLFLNGSDYLMWSINLYAHFGNDRVNRADGFGARPVITISKSVIVPAYYAFGLPTTSSSTDYQTVITESGSKAFVKLEGQQLSVCIYKNEILECFKNNNYEEESVHLQTVFGAGNCNISGVSCHSDGFYCHSISDGNVYCNDNTSGYSCAVNADGSVDCRR